MVTLTMGSAFIFRFKVILGHLQVDNQLPLTVMPVLLAPEQTDIQQPVFKMTLTMRNENTDGIQVFPYTYIRVITTILPKFLLTFHGKLMSRSDV